MFIIPVLLNYRDVGRNSFRVGRIRLNSFFTIERLLLTLCVDNIFETFRQKKMVILSSVTDQYSSNFLFGGRWGSRSH